MSLQKDFLPQEHWQGKSMLLAENNSLYNLCTIKTDSLPWNLTDHISSKSMGVIVIIIVAMSWVELNSECSLNKKSSWDM